MSDSISSNPGFKTISKRSCLSSQEIHERLVREGVRPTAQRIAVCQYVLCEADHPSAEDIKIWIDERFPMMSMATIYNTLKVLVEAGLLREFRFPHLDKVIYDDNIEEHHHFLDEKSGRLFDVEASQLAVQADLPQGYQVNRIEVLIRGSKN